MPPVPDPEVTANARRRTVATVYKLAVLDELDGAKTGETGAILRYKGLYSSLLVEWFRPRKQGMLRPLVIDLGVSHDES